MLNPPSEKSSGAGNFCLSKAPCPSSLRLVMKLLPLPICPSWNSWTALKPAGVTTSRGSLSTPVVLNLVTVGISELKPKPLSGLKLKLS